MWLNDWEGFDYSETSEQKSEMNSSSIQKKHQKYLSLLGENKYLRENTFSLIRLESFWLWILVKEYWLQKVKEIFEIFKWWNLLKKIEPNKEKRKALIESIKNNNSLISSQIENNDKQDPENIDSSIEYFSDVVGGSYGMEVASNNIDSYSWLKTFTDFIRARSQSLYLDWLEQEISENWYDIFSLVRKRYEVIQNNERNLEKLRNEILDEINKEIEKITLEEEESYERSKKAILNGIEIINSLDIDHDWVRTFIQEYPDKAKEELRKWKEEMEKRINERIGELNDMKKQLSFRY